MIEEVSMPTKAEAIVAELRDQLREYDDFIGLYFYGSHVVGKPHQHSDIDVAAIFQNDMYGDEKPLRDAWRLEVKNDVVIDFHPFSLRQLEAETHYFNEVKKGVYYAR